MVQPDMKKLVAYSSVSHLGFVVLGIAALNTQGVQGAVYQMLNHGISTGGLFLIVGMLSDRRHTRLIAEYGGLKKVTPHLVAVFLIVTLSSIGLPGLNGFVGEFLILLGAFRWSPRAATFAATGVILSATYMLWMFQRVNYGPVTNEKNATLPDLTPREWTILVPVVAMAVLMGIFPNIFLRPIEPSVERMLNQVRQGAQADIRAENGNDVARGFDVARRLDGARGFSRATPVDRDESSIRGVRLPPSREATVDRRSLGGDQADLVSR
jgi:NADH-quinone oxidoreductase subunit M